MKKEINYNYIEVPMNLFYLLDGNASRVLTCLIQSSSFFAKEDGFFFLTKEHMCSLLGMSVNVLTAALDTLYINGIIAITTVGKGRGKYVNHYRVIFEEFGKYEDMTFNDLTNPENKIEMVNYKNHYKPQYIKDYEESKQLGKRVGKQLGKKVITNITNIDNIDNITNIDNINNKENINNKKEINIINNIEYIKEKIDADMDINEKITILLSRMDSVTMEELENKRGLFINWIKENITPTEQEEIEKRIERRYNEIYNKIISSANNGENVDFFSSILVNGSTGKTVKEEKQTDEVIPSKSKEQLLEMMEEVVATSTCREDEAANFKMWVTLNEKEINSYGLMGQAEEVFQLLRKGAKEAVLATISTEVEQVPTSKADTVKTPKNTLKTKLPQMEYNERGEGYVRVGDTTIQVYSDPTEYDFIDEIWSEMQMATAV